MLTATMVIQIITGLMALVLAIVRRRRRWLYLLAALVNLGIPAALVGMNARHGCYPWSPSEVPYRDGMTLCPGQTVTVTLPVPPQIFIGDPIDRGRQHGI